MNRLATALILVIGALALASGARADDLKADPVHSFVIFDVHHFGAGYVYGTFAGPTGTVTYDPSDPSKTAFDITVQTDTLDTRNANRDKDVKGADFFDVKQFPTMEFKSTSVSKTGDNKMDVTGDLTVHGVTKSITVPMEMTGTGKGMRGETRTGFRGEFTINRHDYGVDKDPDSAIAAEIHLTVAIEAVNQEAPVVFSAAQILGGLIAPAIVLALLAAVAWRLLKDPLWIFGPLVAAAFCGSYLAVEVHIGWPPTANVVYLLFYGAIGAGALALIDALTHPPIWLRIIVLGVLWWITARLMLQRLIPATISPSAAEIWIAISTLGTITWFLVVENLANSAPGIMTPLLLILLATGGAVFLALGWHIQSSGVLAGELVLLCIAMMVVNLFIPRMAFSRGFAQMIVILLQLLLLHGFFYTDDDLSTSQQIRVGLLMAAPLLCLLGDLPKIRNHRNAILRLMIRLGPVIVLLGIISAMTARDFIAADQAAAVEE